MKQSILRAVPRGGGRQIMLVAVAAVIAALVAGGIFSLTKAEASSHREAPFIAGDPEADATDFFAFVSPDSPDTVTMLANYVPLQVPAGGPNFYPFGDDVLYEINIDNDGDAQDNLTYQFRFETRFQNPDTFLITNGGPVASPTDENLNRIQTYSVSVFEGPSDDPNREGTVIAEDLPVAPSNVGPNSFPGGYRDVADQAIFDVGGGVSVFAGPRDDPFFIDLGGTFDLLQFRALQGLAPVDDFDGLNVNTLAIQVPIETLRGPNDSIIGTRTTSYRQSTNVLRDIGEPGEDFPEARETEGDFVQISRLELPLVNEVVIPVKEQDRWNASEPSDDAQFLEFVQDPELAGLFTDLFGLDVPPAPREDLVSIFLTGIPDLNQPENVVPSTQLRLNMDIPPSAEPSPLGLLGGDEQGFPNGRRPADDIADISLQAVAGATPFTPEFNVEANKLSDGVGSNDVPFLETFPYLNAPHDYAGATYAGGVGSGLVMPDTGGVSPDEVEEEGNLLQRTFQKIVGIF